MKPDNSNFVYLWSFGNEYEYTCQPIVICKRVFPHIDGASAIDVITRGGDASVSTELGLLPLCEECDNRFACPTGGLYEITKEEDIEEHYAWEDNIKGKVVGFPMDNLREMVRRLSEMWERYPNLREVLEPHILVVQEVLKRNLR